MHLKSIAKRALPAPVLEATRTVYWRLRILRDFGEDRRRYQRYAMTAETSAGRLDPIQLEAQLTRDCHRVEKGLALPAPRRPFGIDLLKRLDALIPAAEACGLDGDVVSAAHSARNALLQWNSGGDIDGAVAPVLVDKPRLASIHSLFETRHSVRDYSDRPVDEELLREAAELAASSPSVCNRSPWIVRFFYGEDAHHALRYQHGNSGFGSSVPAVAVISVELGYFAGSGERNQAFIEGGIFACSLMWALHGLGLDSCMLNLSHPTPDADRLRDALGMPRSEVPIMMIAIGYGREGRRVSRSSRRSVDKIIVPSVVR